MQGTVLDYSINKNSGLLSGDDGVRYTFSGSEWRHGEHPQQGMRVDFEVLGRDAKEVYGVQVANRKSQKVVFNRSSGTIYLT